MDAFLKVKCYICAQPYAGMLMHASYAVFETGLIRITAAYSTDDGSDKNNIVRISMRVDRETIARMKVCLTELKDRKVEPVSLDGGLGWVLQACDDEGNELFPQTSGGFMYVEGMEELLELLPEVPL